MSADGTLLRIAIACGLLGYSAAAVTDEELPDVEFLEYLGSWQESDEDWLILNDTDASRADDTNEERSDSVPTAKESTESENER